MMKKAFPRTLPVMAGYLFLGIAYGVALREKGFGMEWALLISTTVYAGSMQFAMLGAMTQPFAPVTMALMTLLVNARHIFYGLSMLDKYADTGRYKPYLVFALTDETYSLVCNGAPEDAEDKPGWYAAVSLLDQVYWVAGSVIGIALGQALPFDLTGIDFAMTALFSVIVTEQTMVAVKAYRAGEMWLADAAFPALLGLVATLGSLMIVGKDSFLLMAMTLMLGCFFLRYQAVKGGVRA
ncbi:MAG: AzlC family ABC transporter permease [Eubacteriales bacterium]|nr:AzlC family ABC transporter permease [Eubacteriales bacterium]